MNKDMYNHEGYSDPTAYEAIRRIEIEARRITPYRPLVYICSPYKGEIQRNTIKTRRYCRFAVAKKCIPIAAHLLFPQFLDEDNPDERRLGLFFALIIQSKCEEVWVFGQKITEGMSLEIEKANERGISVRYFDEHCAEVSK